MFLKVWRLAHSTDTDWSVWMILVQVPGVLLSLCQPQRNLKPVKISRGLSLREMWRLSEIFCLVSLRCSCSFPLLLHLSLQGNTYGGYLTHKKILPRQRSTTILMNHTLWWTTRCFWSSFFKHFLNENKTCFGWNIIHRQLCNEK